VKQLFCGSLEQHGIQYFPDVTRQEMQGMHGRAINMETVSK
jgi:hypothetical protein